MANGKLLVILRGNDEIVQLFKTGPAACSFTAAV